VGGGEHRGNAELLPFAAAASQEHEIHQHAGAVDGRAETADAGGAYFSQRGRLPALVRALAVEIHENWIEAMQYLNMEPLREQKKEALRKLGEVA
jgi:hypothetical protein